MQLPDNFYGMVEAMMCQRRVGTWQDLHRWVSPGLAPRTADAMPPPLQYASHAQQLWCQRTHSLRLSASYAIAALTSRNTAPPYASIRRWEVLPVEQLDAMDESTEGDTALSEGLARIRQLDEQLRDVTLRAVAISHQANPKASTYGRGRGRGKVWELETRQGSCS